MEDYTLKWSGSSWFADKVSEVETADRMPKDLGKYGEHGDDMQP
jgi:hypothetical protein